MQERRLSSLFFLLFLLSIPVTAIFWLFFSDCRGISERDERTAAHFIESRYKSEDVIFPVPDWDIGFSRYLGDGEKKLFLNLHAYQPGELSELTNGSLFFVVDSVERWGVIRSRHNLQDRERVPLERGVVVRAVAPGNQIEKVN